MRNVIIFGNVPLATWAVNELIKTNKFNLIGVVCDKYHEDAFINHGMKEKSLYYYAIKNRIKILSFEDAIKLAKEKPILGVSIRYHRLFKTDFFNCFKPGIINLHGGELPRYRGANIANYAIAEDARKVGGTLHFISEGIDEGDIVERVLIPFDNKLTAFDFFSLTLKSLKEAFLKFINRTDVIDNTKIINSTPQSLYIKQGETSRLYYKKEIEEKRIINFNDIDSWDNLYRKARSYTFPGHDGLIIKNGDEYIEVRAYKNDKKNH